MKDSKHTHSKKFTAWMLNKTDLQKIKGGGETKAEKAERKRCEKAWREAIKLAELEGRTLKMVSGNGNGIW